MIESELSKLGRLIEIVENKGHREIHGVNDNYGECGPTYFNHKEIILYEQVIDVEDAKTLIADLLIAIKGVEYFKWKAEREAAEAEQRPI